MRNITNFNFAELNQFDTIYVLVSGGIDSTYLYEMIKQDCDNTKIVPVNCYNPTEVSQSLKILEKEPRYMCVKPDGVDYKEVIKNAFLNIPKAIEAKKEGKYTKKIFGCCAKIKHDAFKHHPAFLIENSVIVSGIKANDGAQRQLFLRGLRLAEPYANGAKLDEPSFYLKHKTGHMYCYPLRDYGIDKEIKELKEKTYPEDIMAELRLKYPELDHSGCAFCPVLVVFADKMLKSKKTTQLDRKRIENSQNYYQKLLLEQ